MFEELSQISTIFHVMSEMEADSDKLHVHAIVVMVPGILLT